MDFAEFSDIEIVGFATFKQKLQTQFKADVEKEIVEAHSDTSSLIGKSAITVGKMIPIVGTIVSAADFYTDMSRLENYNLPDNVSKNILQRVSNKFNETLNQVENSVNLFVNAVQDKFQNYQQVIVEKDEIIEAKSETICSLTSELDQLKDTFLDETKVANEALEIKRLKYQLKAADDFKRVLQKNIQNLKDNERRKIIALEKANKAKFDFEIDNLQQIIEQLNQRNIQLGKRFTEENKIKKIERVKSFSAWIVAKLADAVGLNDIRVIVENFFKAAQIIIYAWTLYKSVNTYLPLLNNVWRNPENKIFAATVFPIILFCMIKLLKF